MFDEKARYKIDDQVITCSLEENKDLMELLERYELQFAQSRHCKQQQLVYWVYYLDVLIQKSTCTSCNDFNEVLFHRVLRGRCDQGQKKEIKLQVRNKILANFVREGSSKYVYTYFKLHEANDNPFNNSLCLYWMRHVSDYQSKSENADKKQ